MLSTYLNDNTIFNKFGISNRYLVYFREEIINMLNPELFEKFGKDCGIFFNELINSIGVSVADICYTVTGMTLVSGRLTAPQWVAVKTDSKSLIDYIDGECIRISLDLIDEDDTRDMPVLCMEYTDENLEGDEAIKNMGELTSADDAKSFLVAANKMSE